MLFLSIAIKLESKRKVINVRLTDLVKTAVQFFLFLFLQSNRSTEQQRLSPEICSKIIIKQII